MTVTVCGLVLETVQFVLTELGVSATLCEPAERPENVTDPPLAASVLLGPPSTLASYASS